MYKYPSKDLTAKVALGYPLPIFARRSVAGGSSARAPGNQNNESTRLRLSHLIKYAKIYPWQGSVLKRRSSFAAKERGADFDSVGAAPQAAAKSGVNCFRYLKPDDFKETESVPAKFLYKQNCFNSVFKTTSGSRNSQVSKLSDVISIRLEFGQAQELESQFNHHEEREAYLLTFGAWQKSPRWWRFCRFYLAIRLLSAPCLKEKSEKKVI